jgi:arylsulfatase A-like enzyme
MTRARLITVVTCAVVGANSCGGPAPGMVRLYEPGAFRVVKHGPPTVVRVVEGKRTEPKTVQVDSRAARIVAEGSVEIRARRLLTGLQIRGDFFRHLSVQSVRFRATSRIESETQVLRTASMEKGLALWASIPLEPGEVKWEAEIILSAETDMPADPELQIHLLWSEVSPPGGFELKIGAETRPSLLLTVGTEIQCDLPRRGTWVLQTGIASLSVGDSSGSLVVVRRHRGVDSVAMDLPSTETAWQDTVLSLPDVQPGDALILRCTRGEVCLGAPILLKAGQKPARISPSNVLLISLDTVRADHVDPWGSLGLSPGLAAFAARGVVLERAVAQAPVTDASHHSLFTGLHVPRHGGAELRPLRDGIPTLALILAGAGYRTAAFTDGGRVAGQLGFSRGFERYWEHSGSAHDKQHLRDILDRCAEWLRSIRDQRWLAFIHTYQAHSPYTNHENATLPAVVAHGIPRPAPPEMLVSEQGSAERPSRPRARYLLRVAEQNYASEIRHLDSLVGAFLEELDASGLLANTLVVLFSDHGEGFLEHGLVAHDNSLYEELIHVPVLLRFPDDRFAGTRIPDVVQTVDLLPTVLEQVGLSPPAGIDGVSLLEACRSGRFPGRPAVSTYRSGFSVTRWPWKLITQRNGRRSDLYRLDTDPAESDNVLGAASASLVDSLAAPLVAMLREAHFGWVVDIRRPVAGAPTLILEGEGVRRGTQVLRNPLDVVEDTGAGLRLCLAPSPLSRLVILVPASDPITARVAGGQQVALAEGVTTVGVYVISLSRGASVASPDTTTSMEDISHGLAARLRALGYAR